ncbi:MAG: CsbD family protein [Anaerolineae bacterium]
MSNQRPNSPMWDQIAGKWKQFKGEIRSRWGDLTDDEVEQIAGERDKLVGRIQERYGRTRQDAEREVDAWADDVRTRI